VKTDLVIFDFDGVLADSEIIAHRVGSVEMSRVGFPLTVEKSIELFSGIAHQNMPSVIQEEYGKAMSPQELERILKKIDDTLLADLKSITNISEVMRYLEQTYLCKCIASNSMQEYIVTALTLTGLSEHFKQHQIFSASMVKQGKPMPDLFLHAAEQFRVKPESCLVIEDSVVGITAAKAANMPVIGFLGASHAQNDWYRQRVIEAGPQCVANDAMELITILDRLQIGE